MAVVPARRWVRVDNKYFFTIVTSIVSLIIAIVALIVKLCSKAIILIDGVKTGIGR